jgi:hypothetical protein
VFAIIAVAVVALSAVLGVFLWRRRRASKLETGRGDGGNGGSSPSVLGSFRPGGSINKQQNAKPSFGKIDSAGVSKIEVCCVHIYIYISCHNFT